MDPAAMAAVPTWVTDYAAVFGLGIATITFFGLAARLRPVRYIVRALTAPAQRNIEDRVAEVVKRELAPVHNQLLPNHGHSLRDAVDRAERRGVATEDLARKAAERSEANSNQLRQLGRTVQGLGDALAFEADKRHREDQRLRVMLSGAERLEDIATPEEPDTGDDTGDDPGDAPEPTWWSQG